MNVSLALAIADQRARVDLSALDADERAAMAAIPDAVERVRPYIDALSDFAWQRLSAALEKASAPSITLIRVGSLPDGLRRSARR